MEDTKYDEIESCNMHILPEYVDLDVEFIFKLNSYLDVPQKEYLNNKIKRDLINFSILFDKFYFLKILQTLILTLMFLISKVPILH